MANQAVAHRPKNGKRSKSNKSRVTNRKTLFVVGDMRTAIARRYRDICEQIADDLGGFDALSEAQRQLVRRAAQLSTWCEVAESEASMGTPLKISEYTDATNTLARLLRTLGLKRLQRDITPRLDDYRAKRQGTD